jgi:hypothetical protein
LDGLVKRRCGGRQEETIAAGFFAVRDLFDDGNLFFVAGGFGENAAEGSAGEGISELGPGVALFRFALVADAIDHGDVNAIGDSVSALDVTPSVELRRAESFFRGDASRCWWIKHLTPCSAVGGNPPDTTDPNRSEPVRP